jgi:hypothetical protein
VTTPVLSADPKMGIGSETSRCLSPVWDKLSVQINLKEIHEKGNAD